MRQTGTHTFSISDGGDCTNTWSMDFRAMAIEVTSRPFGRRPKPSWNSAHLKEEVVYRVRMIFGVGSWGIP